MNQQEFQEYYKKNKTVVIGVPIIVFVLLLDLLVLKPARVKKREELMGGGAATSQAMTQTAPSDFESAPVSDQQNTGPISAPEPIQTPVYPSLSGDIDSRFAATQVYPYSQGRNIFNRVEKPVMEIVQDVLPEQEESFERPEISYHGFFTLGDDKVAILRFADELLITKVGSMLKRGPFFLRSVLPEKIIISDINQEIKEFEVSLSAGTKD